MASIEVHGVSAHYGDTGDGPPVLLVHAATQHGGQWDRLRDAMGPGYRYLLPDLFDSGRSAPWPLQRELTFDDEADIVLAVQAAVGEPVHLAGHSYGGGVALRAAIRRPRALRSLFLIEPGAAPLLAEAGMRAEYDEYVAVMRAFLAAADAGEDAAGWRDFLNYYRGDDNAWDILDGETQAGILAKTQSQRQVYRAQMSNPTTLAELRALDLPALIVSGDASTAPERAVCRLLADNLPGAALHTIAGAGHPMPASHPAEVARTLVRQIEGTGGA